ncbi:MAG TPA: LPS export ABC transporter permease LptG [Burkholderiaceae bacterium]|nr:LPS export ABC transporter permease LptG [Burkholderiaceae bacterium]
MRTLGRYLRREIASRTILVLFTLVALFAFFELVNQLDEIGGNAYSLALAFEFVALTMPSRAYELMPIAALIGTIWALADLAARSEFTIMRVSGMSTMRLAGTVLQVAGVVLLATYVLGEVVAPPAERIAQRLKLQATGSTRAQQFRSGVWVRDIARDEAGQPVGLRFINVARVRADSRLEGWRIFEFNRDFRLRSISTATSGTYSGPGTWTLSDVVETRIPALNPGDSAPTTEHTQIVREPQQRWKSDLTPEIFGVALVQPERMGAVNLIQYIRHLADNRERTERYEIAFWSKLFYPMAVVVMMMLALPFAYLHVRSGTLTLKIFSGVMIGILFYMMNKLFSNLGSLNTWPPVVVAALPSLVMLGIALSALYWIERR